MINNNKSINYYSDMIKFEEKSLKINGTDKNKFFDNNNI